MVFNLCHSFFSSRPALNVTTGLSSIVFHQVHPIVHVEDNLEQTNKIGFRRNTFTDRYLNPEKLVSYPAEIIRHRTHQNRTILLQFEEHIGTDRCLITHSINSLYLPPSAAFFRRKRLKIFTHSGSHHPVESRFQDDD